jgi:hypothetical protein
MTLPKVPINIAVAAPAVAIAIVLAIWLLGVIDFLTVG